MGNRNVIWKKRAQRRFEEIATWYFTNVGEKAMRNFVKDTENAIRAISSMPTIGHKENSQSIKDLRTFNSHPLISIAYTFNEDSITIRALRSTRMNRKT